MYISTCQLNVHFKRQMKIQRETSTFPEKKKRSTFYFSMRDDVVYRKGNMKRITDDQHSLSLVITAEILVMDASDHSEGLTFFLLLLRHADCYYCYNIYIQLSYSHFSPLI